jgi:hypothetical protein
MDLIKRLRETGRPTMNDDGSIDLEGIDFSAADTYLRCAEQYRRRYVLGKRSPPGINLIEGTSHHHSMEMDNLSKRDKGKQLPAKQLTDLFEERLTIETKKAEQECEEAKTTLDWEGEDKQRLLSRAKILHADYAGKWSHKFEPVLVEQSFTKKIKVGSTEFTAYGQTDLTTKDTNWDYKTSSKRKSQGDVDSSLQLSLYSWNFNLTKVGYIALVKDGTPHIQVIESTRNPGQWIWALQVLASVVRAIRAGSFPLTNPGSIPPPWHCSPRFCGYFSDCRGKFEIPK